VKLTRVTITGADEQTRPEDLLRLQRAYPFVEWGILLSKSSEGRRPRFPAHDWILRLFEADQDGELVACGHLCGAWVRDLCEGGGAFARDRPQLARKFDRLQLNFHAETHRIHPAPFVRALALLVGEGFVREEEFIFQIDDVNDRAMDIAADGGIRAAPLFDLSGGAGVLPASWPVPVTPRAGYAGGLSPENVVGQIAAIAEVVAKAEVVPGDTEVWIDVETHVRTREVFDIGKVERFLEATAPHVEVE
jgi:hypothetical protein